MLKLREYIKSFKTPKLAVKQALVHLSKDARIDLQLQENIIDFSVDYYNTKHETMIKKDLIECVINCDSLVSVLGDDEIEIPHLDVFLHMARNAKRTVPARLYKKYKHMRSWQKKKKIFYNSKGLLQLSKEGKISQFSSDCEEGLSYVVRQGFSVRYVEGVPSAFRCLTTRKKKTKSKKRYFHLVNNKAFEFFLKKKINRGVLALYDDDIFLSEAQDASIEGAISGSNELLFTINFMDLKNKKQRKFINFLNLLWH